MKFARRAFHCFLVGIVVSWHIPMTCVIAQETSPLSETAAVDQQVVKIAVKLSADRMLHGTAVKKNGQPATGQTVVLGRDGKVIAKTMAEDDGKFAFKVKNAGEYQIATAEAAAFVQCFDAASAPENAASQILISHDAMIARGQQPISALCHPLLIGLVIAAAIVIPIVVSNNNDDDAS